MRARPARPPRVSERLRSRLYCGLQALRGRPIARHLQQIERWESLPAAEFDAAHRRALDSILKYAHEHVPRYRTGPWADLNAVGAASLADWPILEKSTLQSDFDELLARPAPARYDTVRTSGTTGQRTTVAIDVEAVVCSWAHRYRGMLWHGIPIGANALRVTHDRRPLRDFVLGQECVWPLESPDTIRRALRYLARNEPTLVAGTPSALFFLARRLQQCGVDRPLGLFARVGGEQLFGFQRRQIEATLCHRAIDSYGSTETGAIAGECPAGSMHIYAEHLHVEVVDGNEPAAPGEFGELVITTLRNTAMPLIRYRVGDSGRISTNPCECGGPHPILEDLQARNDDSFLTGDERTIHSSKLISKLGAVMADPAARAIGQLQFHQAAPRTWHAYVERPAQDDSVPDSPSVDSDISTIVTRIVHDTFGSDCEVNVRFVDNLPREHGKHRYFREQPLSI